MRNLLNFIIKYSSWFVFVFYLTISIILLVIGNSYRQSVYLTSANQVTGGVYNFTSGISGYFHLKGINESLQESNAKLQNEVLNLKNQLAEYQSQAAASKPVLPSADRYDFIQATVINNNTHHPKNFFTINRGAKDGIKTGMGVVNQEGIIGIIDVAGPHLSRVISVLNENQKFSVKVKGTSFVGSLSWRGGDPNIAYLEEIPRHVHYNIGDTIVTSGFSTTFPEGLPAGIILNKVKSRDDSFFTFKIKLTPNFRSLSSVRIIKDIYKAEIDSLANIDLSADNKKK